MFYVSPIITKYTHFSEFTFVLENVMSSLTSCFLPSPVYVYFYLLSLYSRYLSTSPFCRREAPLTFQNLFMPYIRFFPGLTFLPLTASL